MPTWKFKHELIVSVNMSKPLSPATSHVQKSSRIWQRGLRSCSVHQCAKHVYIQYSNMASHASPWKPSVSKASLCLSDCEMRSCTKGLPSTSWPYWKVTQGLQTLNDCQDEQPRSHRATAHRIITSSTLNCWRNWRNDECDPERFISACSFPIFPTLPSSQWSA